MHHLLISENVLICLIEMEYKLNKLNEEYHTMLRSMHNCVKSCVRANGYMSGNFRVIWA